MGERLVHRGFTASLTGATHRRSIRPIKAHRGIGRGNGGRITFHDWHPAGIEEYGYAAPDPLDPDIVYSRKVSRYDRRTGQIHNVEPKPLRSYRVLRTNRCSFPLPISTSFTSQRTRCG